MSNVVSMRKPQEYLLERASRNRQQGRFDEAMALLARVRSEYGTSEELEWQSGAIYEEIGCEEEAARAYLRVMRARGEHRAQALLRLATLAAQRSDSRRGLSYLARVALEDRTGECAQETAEIYEELTQGEREDTRTGRAEALERRALDHLREGRPALAERALRHAMLLRPSAQGYTLLACCELLRMDGKQAQEHAELAHRMKPGRAQTLGVLTDALGLQGKEKEARRALYLAALRSHRTEDVLGAAQMCAQHGEDGLTLRLTRSLLHREPFNVRAMQLRACALVNVGRVKEASRLFGRVSGLLPEDTVSAYYYRLTRDGELPEERLLSGTDVPGKEALSRAMTLLTSLYAQADGEKPETDPRELCRLCAWALRSPRAGSRVASVALMLLGALGDENARETLKDAMCDPQLSDERKRLALQAIAGNRALSAYDIDLGGSLVRVAAGGKARPGSAAPPRSLSEEAQHSLPVQRACNALMRDFPDAPARLMPLWVDYLNAYGPPDGVWLDGCTAALEAAYHEESGRPAPLDAIARRCGVSRRMAGVCLRRLRLARERAKAQEQKGKPKGKADE